MMSGSKFETRSVIKECSTVQDGWTADPAAQRGGGMGTVEKWQRKSVGSLFEVQLGKMLNKAAKEKTPQYPYLTNMNVRWGAFDISQLNTMFFSDREKRKFELRGGDILVCEGGEVGRCAVWDDSLTPCYFQKALHRLRPKGPILPTYFQAYMEYISGTKILANFTSRTSITHLTREKLIELPILLPPLPEQRKIAEILQTWDEAIEKLEVLIDRVKCQHLALSHSLIFGRRRLLRFKKSDDFKAHYWFALPKDWDCQPVGKIATEVSERNGNGEAFEVLSCSKYDGFVRSLEYFKKQVFSSDLTGYKQIWRGDFGFPSNHIEEGSIGLQELVDVGIVSPIYTVFRFMPEKMDRAFAFSALKTSLYRHIFEVSTSASVDRRGSLRWKEFAKIPFPVPPLSEQEAISEVLAVHSGRLAALEEQRDKYARQKRGLMQKLLTGEWRITV